MRTDRRRVRGLLLAVFVPVLIVIAVLATAVLGQYDSSSRAPASLPRPAPQAPPPVQPIPPTPPAPEPPPAEVPTPAPPAPVAEPPLAEIPQPPLAEVPEPPPAEVPSPANRYVPAGAERSDLGEGAQAVSIFRPAGSSGGPAPVVIFLHGWVAIDPARYGAWIGHLVSGGATVICPAYQTRPAYDTTAPLGNVLAGVRAALTRVAVAPGRLVVAGHSAGGALAADYAAVAADNGLPAPAAVFSVYPGRKLRHLDVPIPSADLTRIAPGTRVIALAGERDTAVGSGTARRIVRDAANADTTLVTVKDDAVDGHSAPRTFDGAAQRTFWAPLDALVAATRRPSNAAATP